MEEKLITSQIKNNSEGTAITVIVRVRPQNQRELLGPNGNAIKILDDKVLIFDPTGERIQKKTFLSNSSGRSKNLVFGFDRVFGPTSTQEDIFEIVKNNIFPEKGGLLDGFNCTVFAYGATGSGKTFSMAGSPENQGIMSRSVQYIFESIEKQTGRTAKLRMSYLEIYNEQIRDLLNPSDDPTKELKIVEDSENGINVTNLSYCYPNDTKEVLHLVHLGNSRRTQAQTEANPVSSRSHAVLQIVVENCDDIPGMNTTSKIGKLSLIDLAGSERATTNTGKRLRETTKINCSLLALSNCINMLCKSSAYIPFRQSKLTRLLKDSLGGNCKTICLSCISPSYLTFEDTYNTLQYANKAKNIKTNVTKNTINIKAHISEYQAMIERLRLQVQTLQSQGNDTAFIDAYKNSIQDPFIINKQKIKNLLTNSIPPQEKSFEEKINNNEKMFNLNFKKKTFKLINEFNEELEKLKPQNEFQSRWINQEQRLKTLELENFALKANNKFFEHQINIQQQIINSYQSNNSNLPLNNIEDSIILEDFDDIKTLPPPPLFNQKQSLIRNKITENYIPLSDMSRIKSNIKTSSLREKFEEAQKTQRKPLTEKTNNLTQNNVKQPLNTLMDQLTKRIQSISTIIPEDKPAGILLRARLLKQNQ